MREKKGNSLFGTRREGGYDGEGGWKKLKEKGFHVMAMVGRTMERRGGGEGNGAPGEGSIRRHKMGRETLRRG